jgi:hypothetical protein
MDIEEQWDRLEQLVMRPQPPSWLEVGQALELPDDRWRAHDPANALATIRDAWTGPNRDWTDITALWLGVSTGHTAAWLCPIGYAVLDDTGFPLDQRWHADDLDSDDLTAFMGYYNADTTNDAYDYWVPLAWTGLLVRLLDPAPPNVTILAGFAGGDWLTFPPKS